MLDQKLFHQKYICSCFRKQKGLVTYLYIKIYCCISNSQILLSKASCIHIVKEFWSWKGLNSLILFLTMLMRNSIPPFKKARFYGKLYFFDWDSFSLCLEIKFYNMAILIFFVASQAKCSIWILSPHPPF